MRGVFVRALVVATAALVTVGCGGGDGDGGDSGTKVTNLKLGEDATLTGSNGKLDVRMSIDATEGSIDDLKDFRLEDDEREMTPWYVTAQVENRGEEIDATKDPFSANFEAYDDGGLELKEILPLGDFPKCELVAQEDPIPAGASWKTCNVYLVKDGSTLAKVVHEETHFEGANREFVWKP